MGSYFGWSRSSRQHLQAVQRQFLALTLLRLRQVYRSACVTDCRCEKRNMEGADFCSGVRATKREEVPHGPSRYRQESASCVLRTTTHRLSTAERSCADQRLLPLGLTSLARSACYSRNGLGTLLQPLILVNATGGYLIRLKSTRLTSESSNLFSQSRIHSLLY